MFNFVILFLGIFIGIIFFSFIRSWIVKHSLKILDKSIANCSVAKVYDKNGKEVFSWAKLKNGMFTLFSSVEWAKDISSIINIRKILIYLLIASSIFAFAWYQGRMGAPANIDLEGKEAYIRLNGDFLHITSDGQVLVEDKEGNVIKVISVKDIPELRKKLKPVGLILEPIGVLGYGISDRGKGAVEAGAGVSFFKFWKWRLDAFVTNYPAVYLGTSYKLDGMGLKNSRIGMGIGKGIRDWKLDQSETRAIVYFSVRF